MLWLPWLMNSQNGLTTRTTKKAKWISASMLRALNLLFNIQKSGKLSISWQTFSFHSINNFKLRFLNSNLCCYLHKIAVTKQNVHFHGSISNYEIVCKVGNTERHSPETIIYWWSSWNKLIKASFLWQTRVTFLDNFP